MLYYLFMKKIILVTVLVLLAVYVLPLNKINWGKVTWQQGNTVTVTGEAKMQQTNQLASFSAGAMVTGMDKSKAIAEVNTKINDLIKAVKDFGIAQADIKTQNLSYYQEQKGSLNPGQWQVNNTIEITLRDVAKANDLSDLLAKSGANNVYGPSFRMDDTNNAETGLFGEAIKNAREKAEAVAKASGRTLGKVITVNEGASTSNIYPMYAKMDAVGMGGGAATEPGSTTISKSVTVVWELK
jgi:uncharacterized protein